MFCTLGGSASGAGPQNVLLVENDSSETSITISSYYAERRSIPSGNVCRLHAPDRETVSRWVYEKQVEQPITSCLRQNRLLEQVLYIVTTKGVPLRIEGTTGSKGRAASVDSELTLLYGKLKRRRYPIEGPVPNPLFGKRDSPFRHPGFPIYLVTRLTAYDVEAVKAMIDRSLVAKNRGRVALDLSSGNDGDGNNWLRRAALLMPPDRVILEETEQVLAARKDVIAYASWGSNDKNRKRRRLGFGWLPGAIATEFVSTNGRTMKRPPDDWTFGTWKDKSSWFGGSPQGLAGDLIAEGVTGVSAHVYEPYLHTTPRPDHLLPAYLSGRNLAESFYIAMPVLSWMNIVIGDPLCRLE
ncbi:MAG: TIGR03790 family protein [bacterium]|nr:TIGR03790 family protein [bacterium]